MVIHISYHLYRKIFQEEESKARGSKKGMRDALTDSAKLPFETKKYQAHEMEKVQSSKNSFI